MNDLVEQIRLYAEATNEPAAIGPDPNDDLVDTGSKAPGSRYVLAACLVVLVGIAGALAILTRTSDSAQTATAVGGDDTLSVTMTATGPDLMLDSVISAEAEITNISTQPVDVATRAAAIFKIYANPSGAEIDPEGGGLLLTDLAVTDGRTYSPGSLEDAKTLGPGESIRIEGTVDLGTYALEPGSYVLVATPGLYSFSMSSEEAWMVATVSDAAVSLPLELSSKEPDTPSPEQVEQLPTQPSTTDVPSPAALADEIARTKQILGVSIGGPCPGPIDKATADRLTFSVVLGQTADGDCVVTGYSPRPGSVWWGVVPMGLYDEAGVWSEYPPRPGGQ